MASASSSAPGVKIVAHGVAPLRAGQGFSFVLRRLHSLSGIIPVGAFLFEHILISNATAITGPGRVREPGQLSGESSAGISFSSCSGSGCRFCFMRFTGSISGIAATGIRSRIPGPATGCTRRSAGPAGSPLSTSCGTPTRCGLLASICTHTRRLVRQSAG